jgi:hypothetical protein
MPKTLKVHVSFTLEIDPEMWTANFANYTTPAEIRQDVREYAETMVRHYIHPNTGALIGHSE